MSKNDPATSLVDNSLILKLCTLEVPQSFATDNPTKPQYPSWQNRIKKAQQKALTSIAPTAKLSYLDTVKAAKAV